MMVGMHRRAALKRLLPPMDRAAFREGMGAMGPLAIAIVVWGLVTGVAMVNSGLSLPVALGMTFTVFAGSAQLAVLPLLATSTPLPIVWITALLVNLRFVIFAAASRSSFVMLPWQQRMFAGYLNGDLGFALFSRRFADDPQRGTPEQWGYFYGGAVVNWVAWMASCALGILLGGLAPTDWGLELGAYLALVAVLIPMVHRLPVVAAVAATAVVAVVTVHFPMRLGLLLAVVAGVAVAVVTESLHPQGQPHGVAEVAGDLAGEGEVI